MKLQGVVFAGECCAVPELYVRLSGSAREVRTDSDGILLPAGAVLRTDTYMNVFDASFWHRHTTLRDWELQILACGRARIELVCACGADTAEGPDQEGCGADTADRPDQTGCGADTADRPDQESCETRTCVMLDSEKPVLLHIKPSDPEAGLWFFRAEAEEETRIFSASYVTRDERGFPGIRLGVAICTYHRKEMVSRNISLLRSSRFFAEGDELCGAMQIHVADNGSELAPEDGEGLRIFHNPNTGGSGGFTRALREFRARQDALGLTHIIFMDDDVEFLTESFYRLHAFLSYRRESCADAVVAGRMFRTDRRQVQYTAAEIWNGGDLGHIGFNRDMTGPEALRGLNDSSGADYGGWWLCCFPAEFAMKNEPMPFFLHCDDVEYGLRHGGTPLILNGFQVWHETFEYRKTPMLLYYDTRNPWFVNEIYEPERMEPSLLYRKWFKRITKYHVDQDYRSEFMLIAAMRDFLKGKRFLYSPGALRRQRQITGKKRFSRYENMILWRLAAAAFRRKYGPQTDKKGSA